MRQPDNGKDMIGRPAGDEGSEDERDRLQSLLCAVLCLDLLLLLPTEPDDDGDNANDDGDDDDGEDDDDDDIYIMMKCHVFAYFAFPLPS